MSISKTYKLNVAAASTFGSTSLVGAQSFTVATESEETIHNADGAVYSIGAYLSNVSYLVTVELTDILDLTIGAVNTLTLRSIAQANGVAAGTATAIWTSGTNAAVIKSIEPKVSHNGLSNYVVTFRIISLDGTTPGLTLAKA